VNLRNKTRGELEAVHPFVVNTSPDALYVRCLDTYHLWALKSDVSVTPSLYTHGYWESWITSWFTNNVHEGDFVVDIGANCGYFTMLFEELTGPEGRVVAYEASKHYADLLQRTKNDTGAKFVIENVAVADEPGELTLTYPGDYTGSASVVYGFDPKWGEEHHETVKATTLDIDFEGMDTPDLIKIDAESAEEIIWNGATELLSRHNAPVVVLEYSPTGTYSKEFPERLLEYGEVTGIGYDGNEHPVDLDFLNSLTDWYMIVVRKK
jgi:FkbM family methyltransferase